MYICDPVKPQTPELFSSNPSERVRVKDLDRSRINENQRTNTLINIQHDRLETPEGSNFYAHEI